MNLSEEDLRAMVREMITSGDLSEYDALYSKKKAWKEESGELRSLLVDLLRNIENDEYYCSELIYLAFKEANDGQPVFQLQAMTFNDPDTQKPFPIWVDYYKKLGKPIPEGQPGLNPGGISRSEYIEIIHYYGKPDTK